MRKNLLGVLDIVVLMTVNVLAVLAAIGLCGLVWDRLTLEAALGYPPDRLHPAFLTCVLILVLFAVVGNVGAFIGIILPLHMLLNVPLAPRPRPELRWLYRYAKRVTQFLESS